MNVLNYHEIDFVGGGEVELRETFEQLIIKPQPDRYLQNVYRLKSCI